MGNLTRVLDTNVVLYLLRGMLAENLEPGAHFISVITEMELLSYPLLDEGQRKQIEAFLSKVGIVDLTPDIRRAAVVVRRKEGLKLPDAIVVATAQVLKAELLTNDQRLLRLSSIQSRPVSLKPDHF